ncbi:unnamed protein product [Prorocentrum cordatum]|uniref:Uncharacterized protein n=1 Tax=Prorocentrum cordatum TaxID=2364126 RepID=A0ABN9SXQ6_9DINO|nr:unnamed protein product [Polarella glacialis]
MGLRSPERARGLESTAIVTRGMSTPQAMQCRHGAAAREKDNKKHAAGRDRRPAAPGCRWTERGRAIEASLGTARRDRTNTTWGLPAAGACWAARVWRSSQFA